MPCKEKHVRRILTLAATDTSGIYFFVPFDDIIKSKSNVRAFKAFYVLHLLFQAKAFTNNLYPYTRVLMNKLPPVLSYNDKFDKYYELYVTLFREKVDFFHKMKFLKSDYALSDEVLGFPFSSIGAKLGFLQDLSRQFAIHSQLLNEIVKHTQHAGVDPSSDIRNQCQLQASIPILHDLASIFNLMRLTAKRIVEDKFYELKHYYDFKGVFTPTFELYKKVLEKMEEYRYVLERYTLLKLPNNYSFLSHGPDQQSVSPSSPISEKPVPNQSDTLFDLDQVKTEKVASVSESPDLQLPGEIFEKLQPSGPSIAESFKQSELDKELKKQDELSAKNVEFASQVKELKKALLSSQRTNEALRQKLDSALISANEGKQFQRNYETISTLYRELRDKYTSLSDSRSVSPKKSQDLVLENQRLCEQNAILENKLQQEKEVNLMNAQNIADLQKQLEIVSLASTKFSLQDLVGKLISECVSIHENYTTDPKQIENVSKSSFIDILNNFSQEMNLMNYQLCEISDENELVAKAVTHLHHMATILHVTGQKYLQITYDEEIDTLLKKVQELYISSMSTLKTVPSLFKFSDINSSFQAIKDTLVEKISQQPETLTQPADVTDFDLDTELDRLKKLIDSEKSKLLNVDNQGVLLVESESETIKGCGLIFEILKKLLVSTKKIESEFSQNDENKHMDKRSFYRKNSSWVNGLYGFAKSIEPVVYSLTETVNGFVNGETMVEELVVCMNNVSSLVTQLFMSARTKVDRFSPNIHEFTLNVTDLRTQIHEITNSAKSSVIPKEEEFPDISKLGKIKVMALEKELQIKINTLDGQLRKEQEKLYKSRTIRILKF